MSTPEPTEAPVLELDGVGVQFGGNRALADVRAHVHQGEIVAVVGPNGAGKSTLLNAVSGLLRREARGVVRLHGERIDQMSAARRTSRGIGRSFQNPPLIDALTVVENVMVGAFPSRDYGVLGHLLRWRTVARSERKREEQARGVLEFMGLTEIADLETSHVPYGPRKLVDIARALASEPSVLLLDEPTSGLDKNEQATMEQILRRLREGGGISILMVEHHMDLVRNSASRVIGFQAGEVVAQGPTADVLDSDEFRAALVGAVADSRSGGRST
ncbi:ATP-binding cassette domain-containing protein [Dactylosporangium sp. NPDC000555]|uniref:ABC transporter ATP-binding protein n=1 Tax=Dactylosporangium sp. NPDC000555 TaxID=3154260 RepID=UPI003330C976